MAIVQIFVGPVPRTGQSLASVIKSLTESAERTEKSSCTSYFTHEQNRVVVILL